MCRVHTLVANWHPKLGDWLFPIPFIPWFPHFHVASRQKTFSPPMKWGRKQRMGPSQIINPSFGFSPSGELDGPGRERKWRAAREPPSPSVQQILAAPPLCANANASKKFTIPLRTALFWGHFPLMWLLGRNIIFQTDFWLNPLFDTFVIFDF